MNRSLVALLVCLLAAVCDRLPAQQPPAAAPAPAPVIADPLARDLVASNPTTPDGILRVLGVLIDLHQAAAGKPLLARLAAMPLDDAQQTNLYAEFGAAFFLKLARANELNPAAEQFAAKITATAQKQTRDPAQIAALIDQLDKAGADDRARIVARLVWGHEQSLQALIQALADPARSAQRPQLELAIAAFGSEAAGPLGAVLSGSDPQLQLRAIEIARSLPSPSALPLLLAPAFSPNSSAEVRQAAMNALANTTDPPADAAAAAARLYTLARAYYDQPPAMQRNAEGRVSVWQWDAATKRATFEPLVPEIAAMVVASRWAAAARSILPGEPLLRRLELAAMVEAQRLRVPRDKPLTTAPSSAYSRLKSAGEPVVLDLLEFGMHDGHAVAAAIAAQVLGEIGSPDLLYATEPEPSPLVKALEHADRRLRWAALSSIVGFDPQLAYPGSSFTARALRFFSASSGTRVALVGAIRPADAARQAGLLAAFGFEPRVAAGRRELLKLATASADVELILLDMMDDPVLTNQTIADLRRDARTASLPIGLLCSAGQLVRGQQLARETTACIAAIRPGDVAVARPLIDRLVAAAPRDMVLAPERLAQAQHVLTWCAKLSAERGSLYPWEEMQDELIAATRVPALSMLAVDVLANLETAEVQPSLADIANRAVMPVELRQRASAALVRNIARYGVLLTSVQIENQYAVYNASAAQPAAVQQLLAAILDAIEARSGRQIGQTKASPRQSNIP